MKMLVIACGELNADRAKGSVKFLVEGVKKTMASGLPKIDEEALWQLTDEIKEGE